MSGSQFGAVYFMLAAILCHMRGDLVVGDIMALIGSIHALIALVPWGKKSYEELK